jgi:hypothetical protein
METNILVEDKEYDKGEGGPSLTVFVDDVEFRFDHTPVTGRQIMDKAGIPFSDGLILILEDGSQKAVGLDEIFELKPGRHFKKAPHFKRG